MKSHPDTRLRVFCFDIDGTLTDGRTWFSGDEVGWAQYYNVRDGEAMKRLSSSKELVWVCLSRNTTPHAKRRMELLGVDSRWLGVVDKMKSLDEITAAYGVSPAQVGYVGDGFEDAEIFNKIGWSFAVADGHPNCLRAARWVLSKGGGQGVIEEIETLLVEFGGY